MPRAPRWQKSALADVVIHINGAYCNALYCLLIGQVRQKLNHVNSLFISVQLHRWTINDLSAFGKKVRRSLVS